MTIEKTGLYGALLTFSRSDREGVWFGILDNTGKRENGTSYRDPDDLDKLPALICIPHLIWKQHGSPQEVFAYFEFDTSEPHPMHSKNPNIFLQEFLSDPE